MVNQARSTLGRLLLVALAAGASLSSTSRVVQNEASLSVILDRATAYVEAYVNALSSIVTEERYEQRVTRQVSRGAAPPEKQVTSRTLVSDYLLVQAPGTTEWMPFRDVYSVDGVPLRDANDRLLKPFVDPGATTASRVLEIRKESSRYNIGNVSRDINVPTFALQILGAQMRGAFAFRHRGFERIGDESAAVIEYTETARPTMIRGGDYEDVAATGRFWIRPDTGCVLRSVLETRPAHMRTRIDVTYRYEPSLDIVVPAQMIERHDLIEEVVEGRATYSKIRRFRVTVEIK
jgi:hypothetical protein